MCVFAFLLQLVYVVVGDADLNGSEDQTAKNADH